MTATLGGLTTMTPLATWVPDWLCQVTEAVQPNAILAPQTGVSRDVRGLPVAFVVNAQGMAEQRTLTTGPTVGDAWLVTSGLKSPQYEIVHINSEYADQVSDHDPQVVRLKP